MIKKPKVFFRVDGNSEIGLGHVIRSLALADMLRDNFSCTFIIKSPINTLKEQILEICDDIIVLEDSASLLQEVDYILENFLSASDIIVLDGYHFGLEYQKVIKNRGNKIVFIDDKQHTDFIADIVINHAPGLDPSLYSISGNTKLCLGPDYALLRKPFLEAAKNKRVIREINSIFICFGGSDAKNLTLKVLKNIANLDFSYKSINIVLGGANQYEEQIKLFCLNNRNLNIKIFKNLSAIQMKELMLKSDLAIVPSSSILFEIIAIGMPVLSGYYVDNQEGIYMGFKRLGVIEGVGNFNSFDDYERVLKSFDSKKVEYVISLQQKCLSGKSKINLINQFYTLTKNENPNIG